MSGGSFDYLYYEIEEEPIDSFNLTRLERMVNWLAESEQGQSEAANELRQLHEYLTAIRDEINQKLTPSLLAVIKVAEWWCSNDVGRNRFEAVWQHYIQVGGQSNG